MPPGGIFDDARVGPGVDRLDGPDAKNSAAVAEIEDRDPGMRRNRATVQSPAQLERRVPFHYRARYGHDLTRVQRLFPEREWQQLWQD